MFVRTSHLCALHLSEVFRCIHPTPNQRDACTASEDACRIESDERRMESNRMQQRTTEIPTQKCGKQRTDGRRGSKGGKDTALHRIWCGTQYQRTNESFRTTMGNTDDHHADQSDEWLTLQCCHHHGDPSEHPCCGVHSGMSSCCCRPTDEPGSKYPSK